MNDRRRFDHAVADWLDDGSDATPPEVIDALLLAVRSTPQERDFRFAWRTSPMNRLAYAAAAVAALVVGVAALSALSPRFGIGLGPTPTATIQQTPDASASPKAEASGLRIDTYELLDGQVTFAAAPQWFAWFDYGPETITLDHGVGIEEYFSVLADPLPCPQGSPPADAEALARTIRSDPDLEATEPVVVGVGGIEALRMDVVAATESSEVETVLVVRGPSADECPRGLYLDRAHRMRLYLLDLPGGSSARILAIAIVAEEVRFEPAVDAAGAIVDSFEFHAP